MTGAEPAGAVSAEPATAAGATRPIEARGDWFRDVALVTVIAAVSVTAAQAARPMVTYRAIGLGASPVEIGLVQSVYSLLPMFTAVALGRWVDRFGEAIITALGCTTLALGAGILAVAPSLPALAAGQVLMGFGVIASAIATQSFVANRGPADRQVHRFGWFSVAVSSGQIAGPGVAALIVPADAAAASGVPGTAAGEGLVFVFALLASIVALALVRAMPTGPGAGPVSSPSPEPNLARAAARVLRTPGVASAMFVSLAVASGLDVLIVYLPAYGEATGLTVAMVGTLLAVRAGSTLVSRAFMGRMTDRLGPGATLLVTTALAALAIAILPLVPPVPVLFVLMVLVGLGLGIGQPLTVAWIGIQSPPSERGLAFGVRHTGNLATLVIVPAAMGVIAGAAGVTAIWLVLAIFLGAAALVAARTRFALG